MRYNEEDAILPSFHLFCMLGGRPRTSACSSAGRTASCKANNTQDAAGCAVHPRATQQTRQCVQCKSQRLPKRLQMHPMTMLAPVTEKQNREYDPARCQSRRYAKPHLTHLPCRNCGNATDDHHTRRADPRGGAETWAVVHHSSTRAEVPQVAETVLNCLDAKNGAVGEPEQRSANRMFTYTSFIQQRTHWCLSLHNLRDDAFLLVFFGPLPWFLPQVCDLKLDQTLFDTAQGGFFKTALVEGASTIQACKSIWPPSGFLNTPTQPPAARVALDHTTMHCLS